jgi:DNA-binding PadR family transcriptional regulator
MERSGLLYSRQKEIDSHFRRVYRATPLGRRVLKGTKAKVRELVGDFFQEG